MLEKQLEKKLKTEVEKLGGLCLKLQTPGFTGMPDRLVIHPNGKVWFVEMKAPGETPDDRQLFVIKQLRRLNCRAIYLSDPGALDLFFKWFKDEL